MRPLLVIGAIFTALPSDGFSMFGLGHIGLLGPELMALVDGFALLETEAGCVWLVALG